MYNRYIPEDAPFVRAGEGAPPPPPPSPPPRQGSGNGRGNGPRPGGGQGASFFPGMEDLGAMFSKSGLGNLLGGKDGGLNGLLKSLKLENIDSGDVLLLLIILLLLSEGDDLDLVIALGVVLLMGLGEEKDAVHKQEPPTPPDPQ